MQKWNLGSLPQFKQASHDCYIAFLLLLILCCLNPREGIHIHVCASVLMCMKNCAKQFLHNWMSENWKQSDLQYHVFLVTPPWNHLHYLNIHTCIGIFTMHNIHEHEWQCCCINGYFLGITCEQPYTVPSLHGGQGTTGAHGIPGMGWRLLISNGTGCSL